MKHILYLSTIIILFFSCTDQTKTDLVKDIAVDSSSSVIPAAEETITKNKQPAIITVKDSSQYDKVFIEELSEYNANINLSDKFLITAEDTVSFPDDLPLNKLVVFKGAKGKNTFVLHITRKNLTNIHYNFYITDDTQKRIQEKSGIAILHPMFFLGSETDDDDQTGEAYSSNEYWEESYDCLGSVRIDTDADEHGKKRATISYRCKDNKGTLEDCPTLRSE